MQLWSLLKLRKLHTGTEMPDMAKHTVHETSHLNLCTHSIVHSTDSAVHPVEDEHCTLETVSLVERKLAYSASRAALTANVGENEWVIVWVSSNDAQNQGRSLTLTLTPTP